MSSLVSPSSYNPHLKPYEFYVIDTLLYAKIPGEMEGATVMALSFRTSAVGEYLTLASSGVKPPSGWRLSDEFTNSRILTSKNGGVTFALFEHLTTTFGVIETSNMHLFNLMVDNINAYKLMGII